MYVVDLLEEALELASHIGFEVRREWLAAAVGGGCRIGDNWVLFVDSSLTAEEQLQQATQALQQSSLLPAELHVSPQLKRLLESSTEA